MAAILGSAVASEAVSKMSSLLSGSTRCHESEEDRAERLEMAVLKIQTVAAVSEDWEIAHQPLLKWKAKLKRVGKEGDDILHAHKGRVAERSWDEESPRQDSIPRRMARAAKRFMPFARGDKDLSDEILRRFERVADGADEFLRYVQLGGRPRSLMLLKMPTESLLAGRTLEVSHRKGSLDAFVLLQPWDGKAGSPKDVVLFFSYDDTVSWEKNVRMLVIFHLSGSEHIDIMGIVLASLQLLPPQFGAACETIKQSVREMLSQGSSFSNASAMSAWCGTTAWTCYRSTEPSTDKGCSNSMLQLPSPIIRVGAVCFKLPASSSSASANDCSLPLRLSCCVTPHPVPNKYSHRYELVEPHRLQELSPTVADASLDSDEHWWCPQSCTYMVAERLAAPPPTLQQLYAMENSDRPV